MFPNKSLKWILEDYEAVVIFHDYHSVLVLTHQGARIDETYMPGAFKTSGITKDIHPKTRVGKFFVALVEQANHDVDATYALDAYYAVKKAH